jgi:hypothetical protein
MKKTFYKIAPFLTKRIKEEVYMDEINMEDYPRPLSNWTPPKTKVAWSAGMYNFFKGIIMI